ncbi:MAG: 4-alpha-glucanotransferase [Bacteroidota bacterium]
MQVSFQIHFATPWGQQMYVSGNLPALGEHAEEKAIPMTHLQDGYWQLKIDLEDGFEGEIAYKYLLKNEYDQSIEREFGQPRVIGVEPNRFETIVTKDEWRSMSEEDNALYSSAFLRTLFARETSPAKLNTPETGHTFRFQLRASNVPADCQVGILGNHPALGEWNEDAVVVLNDGDFPIWKQDVALEGMPYLIDYKYVLVDKNTGKVVGYEERENRILRAYPSYNPHQLHVINDQVFANPEGNWRGTGVALPVFSLRSEESTGVGEFLDLLKLADWAADTGMDMIQILPVNDTTATKTWKDSYPYGAISVFALHPMFVRLEAVGNLSSEADQFAFDKAKLELNELAEIDYERVMEVKMNYLQHVYHKEGKSILDSDGYKNWFEDNKDWLEPYGAFCALRDRFGTADFYEWETHTTYVQAEIDQLIDPRGEDFDKVGLYYFIQYHLHLQLLEATEYARTKGIILKGDIPIGISRKSVDAWQYPELFYMNKQAGAPPDDFAVEGQNWGFPTYNWEVMAKDHYAWWRLRMTKMADYFDAYRIDHILGFFRIWQIPGESVQGLMGQFNPSMPFSVEELANRGLRFDYDRMVKPYIRWHMMPSYFEEFAGDVVEEFLHEFAYQCYQFKEEFDSQQKILAYLKVQKKLSPEKAGYYERIEKGLLSLLSEVVFFEAENGNGWFFNPRIALHFTFSFRELPEDQKAIINELYIDYFYKRHDHFWKEQALVKLPVLKEATDMLICGEDLGMVPDCVPEVMKNLGILSLEIQRMPKDPKTEFFHPADAPYLSVVSPSTHDMPPIRAWWEKDPATSQRFYNQTLGREGGAPFFCEPWICEAILEQHFFSPAMWAVLPIQDLLAMDGELRRENPLEEQINVPANPTHYWRYRMHMSVDELLAANDFNQKLSNIISRSGRGIQNKSIPTELLKA